jgi:hypothetical protein
MKKIPDKKRKSKTVSRFVSKKLFCPFLHYCIPYPLNHARSSKGFFPFAGHTSSAAIPTGSRHAMCNSSGTCRRVEACPAENRV